MSIPKPPKPAKASELGSGTGATVNAVNGVVTKLLDNKSEVGKPFTAVARADS